MALVRHFNITKDTKVKSFYSPSTETKFGKEFISSELESVFCAGEDDIGYLQSWVIKTQKKYPQGKK